MRYKLIGAAAAMALAAAAPLAIAQQAPDKDKGPAAQDRGQRPGGMEKPKAGDQPKAEQRRKDQPRATEQRDKDRPKATEQRDKDRPKATERRDKDRPKATEQRDKDRPKATERRDKDRPKATEQRDKDRPKATEQRDKDRPKAAEKKRDRVQVSEEKRSKVSARLRQSKVEHTRINVDVNVGSRIPRSVRLHTLPVAIIEIAPAYRGYRYVVLQNETIVIIDPQTYVVVDVISSGSRRAGRGGGTELSLSAEEMRFILRNVPMDRTVDVRVRLALGAEVPKSVQLLRFPSRVVERVPEIRRYRFVVVDDDVVIVDPTDNAVALVISD